MLSIEWLVHFTQRLIIITLSSSHRFNGIYVSNKTKSSVYWNKIMMMVGRKSDEIWSVNYAKSHNDKMKSVSSIANMWKLSPYQENPHENVKHPRDLTSQFVFALCTHAYIHTHISKHKNVTFFVISPICFLPFFYFSYVRVSV